MLITINNSIVERYSIIVLYYVKACFNMKTIRYTRISTYDSFHMSITSRLYEEMKKNPVNDYYIHYPTL